MVFLCVCVYVSRRAHVVPHLTKAKPALDHMSPPPLKLNNDIVVVS